MTKMSRKSFDGGSGLASGSASGSGSPKLKEKIKDHVNHLTNNNNNSEYTILVLGQDGVGKSAIIVRLLTKRFIGDYDPQLESSYRHVLNVDGTPVSIKVTDTAGQICTAARQDQIKKADAILMVYSIIDRPSFQVLPIIRNHILATKHCTSIPMAIIANKADLASGSHQVVSHKEGVAMATEFGCSLYEVSARDSYQSVMEAFCHLCHSIQKTSQQKEKVKKIMQKPCVSKKLHIIATLKSLKDKSFRMRTHTF